MFDGMSRAIVVVPQEKMIVYPDHDESILEKNFSRFPVLNQVLFANQFLFTLVSVIKSSSMFDGMSRAIVVVPQEKPTPPRRCQRNHNSPTHSWSIS